MLVQTRIHKKSSIHLYSYMHTDSKNISVFFMYKHIHTHTATERQRDQFKDKMTKSSFELIVKDEGSNFFKKQK